MIKLTLFHLDIVDVHNSDVLCALLFCILLFVSPNPDRICACRSVYLIKCCRAEYYPGESPAVALRYSIACISSVNSDAVLPVKEPTQVNELLPIGVIHVVIYDLSSM
jgi:hypothetical protein